MKQSLLFLLLFVLVLPSCKPESEAASPEGVTWVAEDIGGKGIIDNSHLTLSLADGTAAGSSGCNTYRGQYTLDALSLTFGPVASTRMACTAQALSSQERDYLDVLSTTSGYEITAEGALLLKSNDGRTLRFMPEAPH